MNAQDSKQVRYYREHFALMEMLQEALGGVSANKVLAYLLSRYGYAILSELKGSSLPHQKWGTLPQERGTLPQERGNPLNAESLDPFQNNASSTTEDCQNLPHDWGTLPQNWGDAPQNSKSEAELAIFDAMNAF
jgi:hypothetical protein